MPYSYAAYVDPLIILYVGGAVSAFAGIVMLINAINMVRLVWPTLNPGRRMNVIKALILTFIDEFIVHRNLRKCTEERFRWAMHLLVVWGMIILTLCTGIDAMLVHHEIEMCHNYFLGLLGFLPMTDPRVSAGYYACLSIAHSLDVPIKMFYNVGGVLLGIGTIALLVRRFTNKWAYTCAIMYDWYLLILLTIVVVSGFLAEGLRLGAESLEFTYKFIADGMFYAGLVFYCIHLGAVLVLFITIPFTKSAHVIYRYVALTLMNYKGVMKREIVIA